MTDSDQSKFSSIPKNNFETAQTLHPRYYQEKGEESLCSESILFAYLAEMSKNINAVQRGHFTPR